MTNRPRRRPPLRVWVLLGCATAGAAVAFALPGVGNGGPDAEEVPLTEALELVEDGGVSSATLDDNTTTVTMVLEDDSHLSAIYPAAFVDELAEVLVDAGVEMTAKEPEGVGFGADLALRVVPILLILLVLVWAVRAASPGGMLGAKKKRALEVGDVPRVGFADVAGADEAVAELREMVEFLRQPERFEAMGVTRPRGALLVGPPGTGKTLLARAVAGEAGVPFFALAGSDFVETFVGMGARRVRDLFAQARKAERAIIFIDEIDAVGRARGSGPAGHGGEGERENTLVSLLNEMDGFEGSHVLVLAATNRADTLDAALTRPGRLDRRVEVPLPDRRGRQRILAVHTRSRTLADDVDLAAVARQTPGLSGADLAQVVNEACMEAVRRDRSVVDAACFQAAVATVAMGRARTSALVTEHDREVTAWHEAGHTLAALALPDADDPVSVTIIPRGPAGGVTWMSGNDDLFLPRKKASAKLTVALAGRAAEEILLSGEYTQGAAGDLQSATRLATAMVTQYAMTDFGYAQVDEDTLRVGGEMSVLVRRHVDDLLQDAHSEAASLLHENRGALRALAEALLVEETLSGAQVREIVGPLLLEG